MMVDSTNRSRDPSSAIENFPPIEKIAQNKTQPRTTTTVCHGMLAGFREGIDTCSTEVARPSAKGSNLHFGGPAPSGPGAPTAKQTPPAQLSSAVAQLKGVVSAAKDRPEFALNKLKSIYELVPNDVKKALLADPDAQAIIAAVADYVNEPFKETRNDPTKAASRTIATLNRMISRNALDATLAGVLLNKTFEGHEDAYEAVQNGSQDPRAQQALAQLLTYTASTPEGKQAATKLAESEAKQLAERLQNRKPPLPRAKNALDNLLRNKNFKDLKASTRIALLSQIENYRDSKLIVQVIQNLELLAEKWSDEFKKGELGLEDQQRFAKVVAFASQYIPENKNIHPNRSREILDNTLAFILRRDKSGRYRVKVKWEDLDIKGLWSRDKGLVLNRKLVKSGNDKLIGDKAAVEIAAYTLPHETNHALHTGEPDGSYRHLMDEYRAWYVGHVAHVGSPPSQQHAIRYVHSLVLAGASPELKESFEKNAGESRKMVDFIGNKILGLPGKVTVDDIDRKLNDPKELSKNPPAPIPESVDGGPNNLDNRFKP
jgi:hypothetical protein